MPLDPQFRTMLETLASSGVLPLVQGDAAQTRAHYRGVALGRRGAGFAPEQVASATDLRSPDSVPVRVYEPLQSAGYSVIYLHGGGWVVGDLDTHDPLARHLANATDARVLSVDYRLAPADPFPAALDDAESVLAWLYAEDPRQRVGVAGESAGASLAAGLALRARDMQIPLAAQLLLYPATDPGMTSQSLTENGRGYFITRQEIRWFYEQYLPPGAAAEPEVDLAHADVAGVAPALVATAEFDPLRDEGIAFAGRLMSAGVPTRHIPGPGLIHGFAGFFSAVGAAGVAVREIFEIFRQMMCAE